MQTLKSYFKNLKLQNCIDDVLAIKELHFIKDQYFQNIITAVKSIEKSKHQDFEKLFSQFFTKHRLNQKQTLRLLMILHEILRQTDHYQTSDSIIELLFDQCKELQKISDQSLSKMDSYLRRNFSIIYATYLIKAYRKQNKQKFEIEKGKEKNLMLDRKKTTNLNQNLNKFEEDQLDFTIFNLVSDILKLNSDLNQMGRYYSDHQYAINIYLEMLKDFDIYFKRIQDNFTKLTKLSKDELTGHEIQKVYLYLSESERCVSKMNSFYYNKYLFYYVNDKISLKMQLEIPQNFYHVLNKSHHGKQNKLFFDYCLTASHPKHKNRLPDTKESNRSKANNFSKIAESIASMNETLELMQNMQKLEVEKQQNLRKSALF